jgi:hypothetical protein
MMLECKFATSGIKHLENDSHQRRNTYYLDLIFQAPHEAFIGEAFMMHVLCLNHLQ